jgi:hypothetical protein
MVQTIALKKEKERKRKVYSKQSKKTQRRCKSAAIAMAAKGYCPLENYFMPNGFTETHDNKLDHDNITDNLWEESEEASDKANGPTQDTCTCSSINNTSEVESESSDKSLPLQNVRFDFRHLVRKESKESTGDDNGAGSGNNAIHCTSEDKTNDKKTHTTRECLEVLRQEVLAH